MSEWIEWNGGECPVADGTMVDVRYRDGDQINALSAGGHSIGRDASADYWLYDGYKNDIIAYRLHQPEEVKPITDGGWIKCSDRMPEPDSGRRVCAYTPEQTDSMEYRMIAAGLFASVCRDATHWKYMQPPPKD